MVTEIDAMSVMTCFVPDDCSPHVIGALMMLVAIGGTGVSSRRRGMRASGAVVVMAIDVVVVMVSIAVGASDVKILVTDDDDCLAVN